MRSYTDVHTQIYFREACRVLSKQEPQNMCVNKSKNVCFIMRRVHCGINIAEYIKYTWSFMTRYLLNEHITGDVNYLRV